MAKRKKVDTIIEPVINKYYAYYDNKNGNVLALSNAPNDLYETGIEIPYFLFCKVASDQTHLRDWVVDSIETPDGTAVLELMPRTYQSLSFKNSIFEWINETPTENTEVIVEWDGLIKHWTFTLSESCKFRLLTSTVNVDTLMFFVVLESDFDFLIRTIFIKVDNLKEEKIYVPFESKFEETIDKISLASRLVFRSYGLSIKHE
jgi:hypothetical protein